MTLGPGGSLAHTRQRAFTSNLLPAWPGALGALVTFGIVSNLGGPLRLSRLASRFWLELTLPASLFSLQDYLALVDTTGRVISDDKSGAIAMHLPRCFIH